MDPNADILGREVFLLEFHEVFDDFLAGRVSLAQLRRALGQALEEDLACAGQVQAALDEALQTARLPEQTWEALTAEVEHAISEDAPTDWSADAGQPAAAEPPVLTAAVAGRPEPPVPPPASPTAGGSGELEPGTLLRDRFVIVSQAPGGSMGHVYKALDRRRKEAGVPDPWVAIKVISPAFSHHPEARRALQAEAANGRKLRHPNIVQVFDCDADDEQLFISMEWLDGETLARQLDRVGQKAFPADLARRILRELCAALEHAHGEGVIHADVKPGNVFVTRAGQVKLLDFGIARAAHGADDPAGLSARTPIYGSCEVLAGEPPTAADDVFALGMLAYRMLTGQRPFGAANALEAERRGLSAGVPPNLAPAAWAALKGTLAFRRAARTATVAAFRDAFFASDAAAAKPEAQPRPAASPAPRAAPAPVTAVAAPASAAASPAAPDPAESAQPAAGRPRWLWPALAAGLAAAAAAGTLLLGGGTDTGPDRPAMAADEPASAVAPPPGANAAGDADAAARPDADGTAGIATGAPTLQPFELPLARRLPEPETPVATAGARPRAVAAEANEDKSAPARAAAAVPVAAAAAAATPPETAAAGDAKPGRGTVAAATVTATGTSGAGNAGRTAARSGNSRPPTAEARRGPAGSPPNEPAAAAAAGEAPSDSAAPPAEPPVAAAAMATVEQGEPLLASTLSMAMVSPASKPAPAEADGPPVDLDTVPEPVRAPPPTPADYGPAPPPGTPVVEQVPLSSLEFDKFVEPRYPRRLNRSRVTGWVELEFRVNAQGETQDIRVLDAEPAGFFDETAVDAVRQWRFKPRVAGGRPVESLSGVRLRFDD